MEPKEPVKLNASADVSINSRDLPGIIKAFETMDIEKVKILCGTLIIVTLIVFSSLTIIFW